MSEAQPPTLSSRELQDRFDLLTRVAILYTLPDQVLRVLARRMTSKTVAAGSGVFRQGDAGDAMYVIARGRCEVSVEESPGHSLTIALLGPGDFFGEMALLSGEPRTATLRAIEASELLVIDRQTLYETVPAGSDAMLELTRLVDQRRQTLPNLAQRARMAAPGQAATIVALYSPKGGSGRTTIAVNLAAALGARWPGEVLLADLGLPYNHAALLSNLVPTSCLAQAARVPPAAQEEAVLGSLLHHAGGMTLLPGVLRPEQADLINPALLKTALGVLAPSFRFIVFDLGVALGENVLTVFEHSHRIVLLATPELSTLKDISDLLNIFTNVLRIPSGRLLIAMNSKSARPPVSRADVERTLTGPVAVEIGFDGSRPDEAAVRGEILVLTQPRSAIARGAQQLAALVAGSKAATGAGTGPFAPLGTRT